MLMRARFVPGGMRASPKAWLNGSGAKTAPPEFLSDRLKSAGNTLCITEHFLAVWRKFRKQDLCREARGQAH
jgi:hypothetical protein